MNLYKALQEDNGFTLTWNNHVPTTGYVVGYKGYEQQGFPNEKEFEFWFDRIMDDIDNELDKQLEYGLSSDLPTFGAFHTYGAWFDTDDDKFYFDLGMLIPTEEIALARALAKAYNQKAIYHLDTKETINV